MGTGKIVMVGGSFDTTTNGSYSEFQVRNLSGLSTVVGNDIEVTGTGLADLNFPAAVTGGITTTMGNLKIGTGQILGVNKNNGTYVFNNVTLMARRPLPPTRRIRRQWRGQPGAGTDRASTPSGIVIAGGGTSSVTFSANNTYTGTTTVNSGVLYMNGNHSTGGASTVNGETWGAPARLVRPSPSPRAARSPAWVRRQSVRLRPSVSLAGTLSIGINDSIPHSPDVLNVANALHQ